jgi:hypothetical protein
VLYRFSHSTSPWCGFDTGFCYVAQGSFTPAPSCLSLTPVTLATWEAEIKKITVWSQPWTDSSQDSISKITRIKWSGGVPQMSEHLTSKHESGFKPQFHLKKKKKKGGGTYIKI